MTENKSKGRKGEDGLKKVLSLSNPEDVRKFLTSLRPLEQVLYEQARENAEDATKLLKAGLTTTYFFCWLLLGKIKGGKH